MSEKICPNCGNIIKNGNLFCDRCGTRTDDAVINQKVDSGRPSGEKNRDGLGIFIAILSVVSLIIMFAYRAWLGGLIFLGGACLAFSTLKTMYECTMGNSVTEFLKECFSKKGIGEKIMIIVAILTPIVLILATYLWVTVDTVREVNEMFSFT